MKSPFGLVVISSLLVLALVSCEQPTAAPKVPIQAAATASSVAFFTDRAAFTALFPGLPLEDFEKGKVAAISILACPGPLNAISDNACFSPGDIKPGIEFNEENPIEPAAALVLLGPGKFGATSKNIAAEDFGHAFIITFTGGNVTATGMDLVSYFAADVCQIAVFGASGLLGSATAPCTNQGAFWGVTSAVPITQIRIFSPTNQSAGVDNIAFGAGVVAPVNQPPVANAGGPYSGIEGSAVSFNGGGSSDPDGDALTYDWDFGDGTAHEAGVTPSHVYADNRTGGYTVTLKVTDPGGLTATASATANIDNVAPTVGPITAPANPVEVGTSVAATAGFTDPGILDTHTGTFDWGDGASSSATVTEVNGSGSASGSHAYAAAGSYTVTLRVTDKDGGVGQSVFASIHVFQRLPPVAKAGGPYSGAEGSMVQFDGGGSSDPAGAPLTFLWSFGDGATGVGAAPSHSYADNGSYPVSLTVTAANGLTNTAVTTAMISNVAPSVGPITAPVQPVEVGTSVVASANFTDPGVLDTHTGTIDWGDGTSSSTAVSEVNGSGSASGSHAYAVAGVYTVTLTVTDKDGGVGQSVFEFVVVFDTLAGFVTGGGWINSLPGSYVADPRLAGKATFGFVSRYQHGATTPNGNTEFNFRVAALQFHSTSYDWLVVSGSKARFKGSGTINGAGDFAFLLSAVDGVLNGGTPDTFRIRIWDKSTGNVIYDSEMASGLGAPATTPLGGGSIVIHL